VIRALVLLGAVAVIVVSSPLWLPLFGTALTSDDPLRSGDVALVLEGTVAEATNTAELWRQQGLVHDVVIVEAPIKTHALIAYWSDFVRWGLAEPSPTPSEHLRVVRSPSTQGAEQARAALSALEADHTRTVLVVGGGGIGSRLVERDLSSVFGPANIGVLMVRSPQSGSRDPARWFQNAEDRRAVLDSWLQLVMPFLGGYEPGT
jgi:hypothetical protein